MSLNKVSTIVYLWVRWWCGWGYGPPGFSRQKTILYFPWTMSTGQSFPSGKLSGMNPSFWTCQQYTTEYLIAILFLFVVVFNKLPTGTTYKSLCNQHLVVSLSVVMLPSLLLRIQYFCQGERPAAKRQSGEWACPILFVMPDVNNVHSHWWEWYF